MDGIVVVRVPLRNYMLGWIRKIKSLGGCKGCSNKSTQMPTSLPRSAPWKLHWQQANEALATGGTRINMLRLLFLIFYFIFLKTLHLQLLSIN